MYISSRLSCRLHGPLKPNARLRIRDIRYTIHPADYRAGGLGYAKRSKLGWALPKRGYSRPPQRTPTHQDQNHFQGLLFALRNIKETQTSSILYIPTPPSSYSKNKPCGWEGGNVRYGRRARFKRPTSTGQTNHNRESTRFSACNPNC